MRGMLSKSAEKCQHLVFAGIWQSPRTSAGVNDSNQTPPGACGTLCAAARAGDGGGGRWRRRKGGGVAGINWGNMPVSGSAHSGPPLLSDDIISPWKEGWWKFAAGSQLPTGGCHAEWLEKYFSTGKRRLQIFRSCYFCSSIDDAGTVGSRKSEQRRAHIRLTGVRVCLPRRLICRSLVWPNR